MAFGKGHTDEAFNIHTSEEQKICIFFSQSPFDVKIDALLCFGRKLWRCTGALTNNGNTYFKVCNEWVKCSDSNFEKVEDFLVTDVSCVIYDIEDLTEAKVNEEYCYIGQELVKLRNRTGDRHLGDKD